MRHNKQAWFLFFIILFIRKIIYFNITKITCTHPTNTYLHSEAVPPGQGQGQGFQFFHLVIQVEKSRIPLSEQLRHKAINSKCRPLFSVNGKTLVYITPRSFIIFMASVLQQIPKLGSARIPPFWSRRRRRRRGGISPSNNFFF